MLHEHGTEPECGECLYCVTCKARIVSHDMLADILKRGLFRHGRFGNQLPPEKSGHLTGDEHIHVVPRSDVTELVAHLVSRWNSHQEAGHAFAFDGCGRCLVCVDCDDRRIGEHVLVIKAMQMGLLRTGDVLIVGPFPGEDKAAPATPALLAKRQAQAAEHEPPDPHGILQRRPPLTLLGRAPRSRR